MWRTDISFAGPQTGDSGQASNPETTVIPSAGAKPDDAIFAYWTDLDFSKGGELCISTNEEEQTSTITWLDAPYYCHGAGEGEWSSEPDYGPAWHVRCGCFLRLIMRSLANRESARDLDGHELHREDGVLPGHPLRRRPDKDPVQVRRSLRRAGMGARLHRPRELEWVRRHPGGVR